tara:strand:- start:366 stop:1607 length:1242 start_codon:yes stop_codon:yes gene_type:complete
MYLLNNTNKIGIFLILYISLLIGFYFGENSSGGAYPDFLMRMSLIDNFNNNFKETFLNYHNLKDRHSPLLIIIMSFINNLGIEINIIRLIHLNFIPLLVFISYKCLILKFPNNNKNLLFLICCVFFLSASLRSIAIWPDSRLIGLFIFLCSVYFFIKFKIRYYYKDAIYSNLMLIISAYFSPNFSIFFIYFFFYYLKFYNFSKQIIILLILNFILSLPMFFYIFVLDVNFFSIKAVSNISTLESFNISNKIFIISSLIFFYLFPFISNKSSLKLIINEFKINHLYFVTIIFFLLLYFFNYSNEYTGGGIFFKFSNVIFGNSYFFFLITFISLMLITNLFKININNLLLFSILIMSNPQLTIYHKYFDPLLIMLFFLFFDFKFRKKKLMNTNFLINIYVFYTVLFTINLGRYII